MSLSSKRKEFDGGGDACAAEKDHLPIFVQVQQAVRNIGALGDKLHNAKSTTKQPKRNPLIVDKLWIKFTPASPKIARKSAKNTATPPISLNQI